MDTKSARFENKEFCSECVREAEHSFGVTCCERNPCLYAPSDFGETSEDVLLGVEKAIREKRATLRYARRHNDERILVSAPGLYDEECYTQEGDRLIVDPIVFKEYHRAATYGKYPCLFLMNDEGCPPLDKRPLGGAIHACTKLRIAMWDDWDKLAAEIESVRQPMNWESYQAQLRELAIRLYKEMMG